ncbi:MAG TPA: helix-turn-helix transcriptional regulator [Candidatus Merdicola faecigallinarum]|uniref:Helix-turn-helix transcriptional regulator n=1 Tax=Candidatus Merdicola faecigallinarum TaxID=2840862 RepID=A0A9D1M0L8_9FIRM|nr:helix-turn-helix transcriptional regulator [Candidatus Merdicola faecigallinarum]
MDYGGDMRIEILVKELRKNNNLTLEQLAERTGVSKSHINDIENGLKEPGLSVLVRLAKALDVQVTELYRVIWR